MKHSFFLGVLFILLLTSVFASFGQEENVEVEYRGGNEPVKIVNLKIGKIPIESGKNFSAQDDWLKDLTATVENSYGKTVSYVELGVIVMSPEGQENVFPYHYMFWLGNRRKQLDKSVLKLGTVSDNKQADLSLPVKEYASIRASLDKIGHPAKVKKVLIQVEEVTFEDGTVWSMGRWYRIDNNNVGELIPINEISQ